MRASLLPSFIRYIFSFDDRIADLETQDQAIEDPIRQIYEGQLLYNHSYDKEDPAP